MAYAGTTSTSPNVPILQTQSIAGVRTWHYTSTHISSDISAVNFFTDGLELGFKVGDQFMHHTSTGGIITSHSVLVVGSTTTDISAGSTVGLGS